MNRNLLIEANGTVGNRVPSGWVTHNGLFWKSLDLAVGKEWIALQVKGIVEQAIVGCLFADQSAQTRWLKESYDALIADKWELVSNNGGVWVLVKGDRMVSGILTVDNGIISASAVFMKSDIVKIEKTYKIGETGPAGGIIFYDKGRVADGWRYLEAAPANTEFTVVWGPDKVVAGTGTGVGSGKRNTQLIVAAYGTSESAARRCANLNINGCKDWFLPSQDELGLILNNLVWDNANKKMRGLGGFKEGYYWSSSINSSNSAVRVSEFVGLTVAYFSLIAKPANAQASIMYLPIGTKYNVRAIRAF
jgi:hypothetical protein